MKTAVSVIMVLYAYLLDPMGFFLWTCTDLGFMLLKRKGALSVKIERMGLTSKDLQSSCLILDLFSKEYKHPTFSFIVCYTVLSHCPFCNGGMIILSLTI